MKKIEAIIRPEKLEPLKEELLKAKINGITINQVSGCGKQLGYTEHVRGTAILMNTLPKVEIKIVIPDDKLEETINIICDIAETGNVGDGKIFVTEVVDCVRIRTRERGNKALL